MDKIRYIYRFNGKRYVCVEDSVSRCATFALRVGDIALVDRAIGHVDVGGRIVLSGGGLPPRFNATVASQKLLGRRPPKTIREEENLWA